LLHPVSKVIKEGLRRMPSRLSQYVARSIAFKNDTFTGMILKKSRYEDKQIGGRSSEHDG